MAKVAFFKTQGVKTAFVNSVANAPLFLSGNRADGFFTTKGDVSVFLTGSKNVSFLNTFAETPIFITANQMAAFLRTITTGTQRDLVLKIGELTINSAQSQVTVPDDTGTYDPLDPTLDPGGYNPETALNPLPYRPKRSEVLLWTVYKIHSRSTASGYGDNTQTPLTQPDETLAPYTYDLALPEELNAQNVSEPIKGIYEIILIAAPLGEYYNNYIGTDLYTTAEQTPGWYITSVGIMIDADVINCLNKMRYGFLQGVMCGRCDEEYLNVYAIYVGMISAMEIQEWAAAVEYYFKLKDICAEMNCNGACGCSGSCKC